MTKQIDSVEKVIRGIRRVTRRQYSAEEKIRIVLEGLRGESSSSRIFSTLTLLAFQCLHCT